MDLLQDLASPTQAQHIDSEYIFIMLRTLTGSRDTFILRAELDDTKEQLRYGTECLNVQTLRQ